VSASLLTRIAQAADPHSSERSTWKAQDLETAIREHLSRMLNTRQGSALTCPDFGVIEVSEVVHDFPDAIGIVQRSLKNTIQTYEPRLRNVQVRHVKNEQTNLLTLEFEITAQYQLPDGRRVPLRFGLGVDGSSNVTVA
jgi:type VI secretion system protein